MSAPANPTGQPVGGNDEINRDLASDKSSDKTDVHGLIRDAAGKPQDDNPLRIRTEHGEESTRVVDKDKAWDMAKAGKLDEELAAYFRGRAKVLEGVKDDDPHRAGSWDQMDELRQKLKELNAIYDRGAETGDLWSYHRDDSAREQGAQDLRRKAEELQKRADTMEYWQGQISDHPDIAGKMKPIDCIKLEEEVVELTGSAKYIDSKLEELKEWDSNNPFSVRQAIDEFDEVFKYERIPSLHDEWRNLISNNATTIGDIKEFLFARMADFSKAMRERSASNAKLLARLKE